MRIAPQLKKKIIPGALAIVIICIIASFVFPWRPGPVDSRILVTLGMLKNIEAGLTAAYDEYGTLPNGEGPEPLHILKGETIMGQNPRGLVFLKFQDKRRYNKAGDIVDLWGNPIRLKIESAGRIAIYSFGANRTDDGGMKDDLKVVLDIKKTEN
jgi:hypothetical protein